MTPDLLLTCDPGLEDVALAELAWRAERAGLPAPEAELRPFDLAGHLHVRLDAPPDVRLALVRELRSVHRVVRPIDRFPLPSDGPAGIRRRIATLAPEIPELAPAETRFRASCSRVGTHPFTSEDVEREVGAGVRDVLPRAVRLKDPDVVLRCDVRGDTCVVGVQLPGPALSRRDPGPFRPTTTLRGSVAWGLCALARPFGQDAGAVLDPFCGAGTILVEASARWPGVRIAASDLHVRAVEGARQNLIGHDVRMGDARRLAEVWPDARFDTVVTNPPFGRRLGREMELAVFYRLFLASALAVTVPGARLVVLVEDRGAFNRAWAQVPAWRSVHVRVLEMGGLYVGAFVLERGMSA